MRRRILHEIKLDKIAAVDRPCQEPARAVFMKRAGDPAVKPGDNNGGSPMSAELKKALGLPETASDADVAAAISKNIADTAAAKTAMTEAVAKVERISKVAALPADQRSHFDGLEKAGKTKEADDFLGMDDKGRKAECAKALEGDETFTGIDGHSISKKAVGDGVFAMLKSQDERLRKQDEDIRKANERAEDERISKRVSMEFAHLAGTEAERALVLKHLATAPEPVRKAADALLKAAESASKFAFERAGSGGGFSKAEDSAEGRIEKAAAAIRKAEPQLTEAQAYRKAMEQNPNLYAETVDSES